MKSVSFTIHTAPRTKKNHKELIYKNGHFIPTEGKAFKKYEKAAKPYFTDIVKLQAMALQPPFNIRALFYMDARRKVDLVNLEQALCDLLVDNGIVEDDNYRIIASMDGSRVFVDKENPRTEVTIEETKNER